MQIHGLISKLSTFPSGSITSAELATLLSDETGTGTAVFSSAIRELLTADRTYYVRTDGSDSNTGLANSSGGAFLTIQKAVDVACALDLSIYAVTITVVAGTYTTPVVLKHYSGVGPITIVGDETTPSNVIISTTGADCITADGVYRLWQIRGMKLQTTSGLHGIVARGHSYVTFQNLDFGAMTSRYHLIAYENASIICTGNYTISGSCAGHAYAFDFGLIKVVGVTVTLTGTPAWSSAGVTASYKSMCNFSSNTYSGSATGVRHLASVDSTFNTDSTGDFPGNAAGTPSAIDTISASGGLYH